MRRGLHVEDMSVSKWNNLVFSVVLALAASVTGCGRYPAYLSSRRDISFASEGENHVNASKLSIADFPSLAKFTKLYEIDFDDNGVTYAKLGAVAQTGFTNLAQVVVTDGPRLPTKVSSFCRGFPPS